MRTEPSLSSQCANKHRSISISFSEARNILERLSLSCSFNFMHLCPSSFCFLNLGLRVDCLGLCSVPTVGPVENTFASPDGPSRSALLMTLFSRMALLVPSDHLSQATKSSLLQWKPRRWCLRQMGTRGWMWYSHLHPSLMLWIDHPNYFFHPESLQPRTVTEVTPFSAILCQQTP